MLRLLLVQATQTTSEFSGLFAHAAEGVSVAAVIAVVVLFLRRQKESQDSFEATLTQLDKTRSERDAHVVAALDRVAEKVGDLSEEVARCNPRGTV